MTGACADGYVCLGGAIFDKPNDYTTGRPCFKGHYCTGGVEINCPGGTYASVEQMSACLTCPPGSYCNDVDGTKFPEDCTQGNYCPSGTETPKVCPDGTYSESF